MCCQFRLEQARPLLVFDACHTWKTEPQVVCMPLDGEANEIWRREQIAEYWFRFIVYIHFSSDTHSSCLNIDASYVERDEVLVARWRSGRGNNLNLNFSLSSLISAYDKKSQNCSLRKPVSMLQNQLSGIRIFFLFYSCHMNRTKHT